MKQKVILCVVVVTSLQLTASVGGGLAGAVGGALEFLRAKYSALQSYAVDLDPQRMFDVALEKKDPNALKWLCPLVPQKHKNEKIDEILSTRYSSLKRNDYERHEKAKHFLSNIIRHTDTDLNSLTFYATLFTRALPNKRSVLRKECFTDDSELPVLRQLLTTAAEHAKPEVIALLGDRFGASVNVFHHDTNKRDFPVHAAIRSNTDSAECLKVLVARGADLQKHNRDHETPLTLAVGRGHYRQAAWLLHQPGIWEVNDQELSYAKHRLQQALPGQEPTHEQLIEESKAYLWHRIMTYRFSDLKRSQDRLSTMRVLRACNIPVTPDILLQALKDIHDRRCSATELHEIRFLHKTILAQHPDFKVTAEHLEHAPEYEMIPGIKDYLISQMYQQEQNRYWDRVYAGEDSNAEALSDPEDAASSLAAESDYASAPEEDNAGE